MLNSLANHDVGALIALFGCGAILALVYFAALWFSVRRLAERRHPVRALIMSLAARLGFVLAAFYAIAASGSLEYMLAALLGFAATRLIIVYRCGRALRTRSLNVERIAPW